MSTEWDNESPGVSRRELFRRTAAGAIAAGPLLAASPDALAASNAFATTFRKAAKKPLPPVKPYDQLDWASPEPFLSLDPVIATSDTGSQSVISNVHEGLLTYTKQGKLAPAVATSWSQTGPDTYVFNLRPGVKWSDGSPLTAEEVVWSLQRSADPTVSRGADLFAYMDSVTAPTPSQIQIKTKGRYTLFPYALAHPVGKLTKRSYIESKGSSYGNSTGLTMGTGPYMITDFTPGVGVTYVANPNYWGAQPAAQKVKYNIITDDATRLLAMQSGAIAGSHRIPLDQVAQWKGVKNTRLNLAGELRTGYLAFNMTKPPFDDKNFRKCIAHCFDRDSLVKGVLGWNGRPANSFVAPGFWAGMATPAEIKKMYAQLPTYGFDLKKAKEYLGKSDAPKDFGWTIVYPDSRPLLGLMLQNLSANMAKIGLTLTVQTVSTAAWLTSIANSPTKEPSVGEITANIPDPMGNPLRNFVAANIKPGGLNTTNWNNHQVEVLLSDYRQALKLENKKKIAFKVMQIAQEEVPYAVFWWTQLAEVHAHPPYNYNGFTTWFRFRPWASLIQKP